MTTLAHWIGGGPDEAASERHTEVTESATGAVVARVPMATPAVVDRAVAAARGAAEEWGQASIAARTKVMFAFRELVHANREELARLIVREHGKVFDDAMGEVQRGLEVAEFACGVGELLKGGMSAQISRGVDSYSLPQPVGVAAGITPFNFPVMVPMWMFPVALACGNAFVLKPSEQDPSASLKLAELLAEAGLPDGAFNVVHGDREAVDALLTHEGVDSVSFVGSTPIARHIYETATAHGKRVQALGGAKNHAVVLPDADLDVAADALVSGGLRLRRPALHGGVGGGRGRRHRRSAGRQGARADGRPDRRRRRRRRVGHGAAGQRPPPGEGARPRGRRRRRGRRAGGGRPHARPARRRPLPRPVPVRPRRARHEHLRRGGVRAGAVVVRRATYPEALELVNANPHGNGAALFTNDGGAARLFEQKVTAGMVGINVPIPVPMAYHSFGGWKASLFGDLHVHGRHGVRFYTRDKVVTRRWIDPAERRGVDLGFPTSD